MFDCIDTEKVAALIRACAATYIVPRYNVLAKHEIMSKSGPNDLVTVADRETEEALERGLLGMYPGSVLIGEEGISLGRATTETLKDSSLTVWVADPVDGTWNFVHGGPHFCVMLACVQGGETRHAWIYDVPGNRMMTAEKGAGAYIDGQRLSVAAPKPLKDTDGFCGSFYFPKPVRPYIHEFGKQVRSLSTLRCAGHEYLRLASGEADFGLYGKIRPWDHLPGALAVTEAGGQVMKWDGSPYLPSDEFSGIAVAAGEGLMNEIRRGLIDRAAGVMRG